MNKAVFLDRDGVLNETKADKDFYYKESDIIFLPKVYDALKIIKDKGYKIFVITNQPVVARGMVSLEDVKNLHKFINKELKEIIEKFYICPHHPEMHPDVPEHAKKYRIACNCRKPLPGMIFEAAKEFDIDLNKSWMIGDMITDILCGKAAGCMTIQILSPHNKKITKSAMAFDKNIKPDYHAKDLLEAAGFI